jgi:hypothetical protein
MIFSSSDEQKFRDEMVSLNLLDDAVAYITTYFGPEDIFSEKALNTWAEENGYIKE